MPPVGTTGNGTRGPTEYGKDCNSDPKGSFPGMKTLDACVAKLKGCKMANLPAGHSAGMTAAGTRRATGTTSARTARSRARTAQTQQPAAAPSTIPSREILKEPHRRPPFPEPDAAAVAALPHPHTAGAAPRACEEHQRDRGLEQPGRHGIDGSDSGSRRRRLSSHAATRVDPSTPTSQRSPIWAQSSFVTRRGGPYPKVVVAELDLPDCTADKPATNWNSTLLDGIVKAVMLAICV